MRNSKDVLKNQELMHEFYAEISEKYPHLSLEQVKEVAYGPWKMLREEMETGALETIRLKYFGSFQVYEGRAKRMLENLNQRMKLNKISPEDYFKYTDQIKNYLKREVK